MRDAAPHEEFVRRLVASRCEGYGLPRPFYHDRRVYESEIDGIWRRGWVFACHTCELPGPGSFVTLDLDTDPVLVVRDDEATIRAFHNICTHRGTLLIDETAGQARAIVCPYHQWTFSSRGDLLKCAGMHDVDKAGLGLLAGHAEVCAGLVFISLAATPPPFAPARQAMAPLARPQGFERARVAATMDYEVRANWKLVWENNRECYHCNVSHPQYIKSNFDISEEGHGSPRVRQRVAEALARAGDAGQDGGLAISHRQGGLAAFPDAERNIWYSANRTVLAAGYATESLDGRRVAPLMGNYEDAGGGVLRMRTLPNFWSHASCDHAVTTRLLPRGLDLTTVRVRWLVDGEAREGVDYDRETLMPFWQLTSEQDWALCARAQRGVASSAYQPGPLSRTREYNLDAFLRWYLHQMSLVQ
jgi:Rieske 2Fe-2S family protein